MTIQIAYGGGGDAQQQFVNTDLQQLFAAYAATAGQNIDFADRPTTNALENLPGTDTDLYRTIGPAPYSGVHAVHNRYGVDEDRTGMTATFDLKSGWNTVKNVSVIASTSDQVVLDGFVHFDADFHQVTSGANTFTAYGVKSGNYLGGADTDFLDLNLLTNVTRDTHVSGWNNDFHIATGAGRDVVVVDGLDFDEPGIAGDTTYTQGQFLKDDADTSGQFTRMYIDLGTGADNYINSTLAKDTIYGAAGDDIIHTGGGDDFIDGGSGNDKLSGDLGADIFHFAAMSGKDRIMDFSHDEGDKLRFDAGQFASADDVVAASYVSGKNTIIDPGHDGVGDIITLVNFHGLSTSDIIIG